MTKNLHRDSYRRERGLPYISRFPRYLYGERVVSGVKTILADTASVYQKQFPNIMVDFVTPDFQRRKSAGDLVMSPMQSVYAQWTGSDSGFQVRSALTGNYELWEERSNAGPIYFGPPSAHPGYISLPNIRALVATKTLAAVKPSNFQGLVALAEGKKTLNQLMDPLGSLRSLLQYITQLRQAKKNLVISVVSGDFRRINGRLFRVRFQKWKGPGKIVQPPKSTVVVKIGDALSGSVLAHNLGLRPLLMDLDSILHEIPNAHKVERQTYRESQVQTERYEETRNYTSGAYQFTARVVTDRTVTVRGVAVAADQFDALKDFGISLSDVPEAFWELLPFSFLADYLLNIGDYLGALKARSTQRIVGECLTTVIDTTVTRTWLTTTVNGWIVVRALSGSDVLVTREKSRETGLGQPALAYSTKAAALTPSHIQNTLSLLCQLAVGLATRRKKTPFY